jgi:hypothetical protein
MNEMRELNRVKELLKQDMEEETQVKHNKHKLFVSIIPILHNKDKIFLQFSGWSINLYEDGTWIWEATDGG